MSENARSQRRQFIARDRLEDERIAAGLDPGTGRPLPPATSRAAVYDDHDPNQPPYGNESWWDDDHPRWR